MTKPLLTAACTLIAAFGAQNAFATEYGRVISSTPDYAQVSVPQQQCYDEQQAVRQPSSGGGALLGAVVGGVVGNTIGRGTGGRTLATGVGAVVGAAVGDRAEAQNAPVGTRTVQRCQNTSQLEERVVAYNVVYEYAGRRYSTRTSNPPGDTIALNVNVAPESASAPPPVAYSPAPVYAPAPVVYAAPAPVYYGPPAYYGPRYYYGPPAVTFGANFHFGGHRRW
jgi:uncharacterized protein YcfJ